MGALRRVIYRSRALGASDTALDDLLRGARRFNGQVGVTGVLLYDGQRFFQFFEGTHFATDEVFARIRASGLHDEIELLADASVHAREFDRWHMGFSEAPQTFLQSVMDFDWQQVLYSKVRKPAPSAALEYLRAFLDEQAAAGREIGHALPSEARVHGAG